MDRLRKEFGCVCVGGRGDCFWRCSPGLEVGLCCEEKKLYWERRGESVQEELGLGGGEVKRSSSRIRF